MLSVIEQKRLQLSKTTEAKKKSQLGQFFTSEKTAAFMANLFTNMKGNCHLLDAGAGIGSLLAAFLDRWQHGEFEFQQVEVDAFEIDSVLVTHLSQTLNKYRHKRNFLGTIYEEDFIFAVVESLTGNLFSRRLDLYTHAILNPPYRKINSNSPYRQALRQVGLEVVNLYTAFVALAVAMVVPGGQIVAIIPRSFCNGPYYRPFREFILNRTAIQHLHLFHSRSRAFKDDDVLQENIIIRLERSCRQGMVTVSTSTDDTFSDIATHEYSFNRVVPPDDPEQFIHVPTSKEKSVLELAPSLCHTLTDLDIKISTGPIVDFRLKTHLRRMPVTCSVPLIYPGHLSAAGALWPNPNLKNANAIMHNNQTKKWFYPNGFYCVVRRFSSKEEKRRVVANVIAPSSFPGYSVLGFENHINVFHMDKKGLPELLAHGLAVFLNTTAVDEYFRCFNGHTQVNATDLRQMKYPSYDALIMLGKWATQQEKLTQSTIDGMLKELTK